MNNDNDPDEQPTQSFRNRLTGEVAEIPTEIDPKTGKRIVLWDDILSLFQDAGSIRNANALVPFLKDDNLQLFIPKRIAYHPGVILDMVVKTTEQTISTREDVRLPQIQPARTESKDHDDRLDQTLTTLTIADNTNQSLVVCPEGIPHGTQSSILTHNPSHNTLLHPIMSGQVSSKQSIDQNLNLLQGQIAQMEKKMDGNFDKTIRMQQQALDRLAVIQNRVEAVITQTYELLEYPIPRLFIVLPKAMSLRDKFKNLFSDQFR
ncbi:hypothetical protein BGZ65_004459, partial [Modicella reniformis]